jgi:hypothetical protein
MKAAPERDMGAQLAALAALIGADLDKLTAAILHHPYYASPGQLVEGEEPLGVGTKLNLRRGFPSGKHPADLGWYVAGYKRRRRDQRWEGYVLVQMNPWIQTTTAPDCEAFDIIEPREVLPQ